VRVLGGGAPAGGGGSGPWPRSAPWSRSRSSARPSPIPCGIGTAGWPGPTTRATCATRGRSSPPCSPGEGGTWPTPGIRCCCRWPRWRCRRWRGLTGISPPSGPCTPPSSLPGCWWSTAERGSWQAAPPRSGRPWPRPCCRFRRSIRLEERAAPTATCRWRASTVPAWRCSSGPGCAPPQAWRRGSCWARSSSPRPRACCSLWWRWASPVSIRCGGGGSPWLWQPCPSSWPWSCSSPGGRASPPASRATSGSSPGPCCGRGSSPACRGSPSRPAARWRDSGIGGSSGWWCRWCWSPAGGACGGGSPSPWRSPLPLPWGWAGSPTPSAW